MLSNTSYSKIDCDNGDEVSITSNDGESKFTSSKSISGGGGVNLEGDCINVDLHMGHVRFLLYINHDCMQVLWNLYSQVKHFSKVSPCIIVV